jgi:hypothetical protein
MGSRPVSIAVSPVGEVLPKGTLHATMRVYAVNTGTRPVSVTVSKTVVVTSGHGCGTASPPSWLTVTPGHMTLDPGKTGIATMTVDAPKATTGQFDLVAVFGATGHASGPVHLTDSIGTQMIVRVTGGQAIPPSRRHQPPACARRDMLGLTPVCPRSPRGVSPTSALR